MKRGSRFRLTERVFSTQGCWLLPGTKGKVLFAAGENSFYCEFTDVEVTTGIETKTVSAIAAVVPLSHMTEVLV